MAADHVRSLGERGPTLDVLANVLSRASQGQGDATVARLLETTAGSPNPGKPSDVVALRLWLNAWNCRIPYPRDDADLLVPALGTWWKQHRRRLTVPAHVGRPQSTLVRIYDEWCYEAFTRGAR